MERILMPFVDIGKERINYVERGASTSAQLRTPVVFIHGAGSSHLIWGSQVRALGDRARALALDLPGHFKSDGVGRDSIAAYAEVVLQFLDALALERAIVVGHSMGGAIAQSLALAYPDRVAALALVATGARLRVSPAFLEGFQNDFENTVDKISAYYFARDADPRLIEKSAALLRACGQLIVLGDFTACNGFDASERIPQISVPTLVLGGTEDQLTPPKSSEFLAVKIPDAQLVLIDGAGHHVMIEKADAVNRVLKEFVQRN
jgi:pimeloyl-ACP methyl ester carboxylesterase